MASPASAEHTSIDHRLSMPGRPLIDIMRDRNVCSMHEILISYTGGDADMSRPTVENICRKTSSPAERILCKCRDTWNDN